MNHSAAVEFGPEANGSMSLGQYLDLATGFLRRRYIGIIICILLVLPFGAAYWWFAPVNYTASSVMMIETQKTPLRESSQGSVASDPGWIESQIGIIRSQNVVAY